MGEEAYALLALPGDRHEDVQPLGLYTFDVVAQVLGRLSEDYWGRKIGLFLMPVDPSEPSILDPDLWVYIEGRERNSVLIEPEACVWGNGPPLETNLADFPAYLRGIAEQKNRLAPP